MNRKPEEWFKAKPISCYNFKLHKNPMTFSFCNFAANLKSFYDSSQPTSQPTQNVI